MKNILLSGRQQRCETVNGMIHQIFLWQMLVDVVNSLCHDLFLSNWESQEEKHVTADDDKYHFNGRMGFYDTCGLKPSQFIREIGRGFVFHTLVFTASNIRHPTRFGSRTRLRLGFL
jgi:hypothetical protein